MVTDPAADPRLCRDAQGRPYEYVRRDPPTSDDDRWVFSGRVAACGMGAMPGDYRYEGWAIYYFRGTIDEGRAEQDNETVSWWDGLSEPIEDRRDRLNAELRQLMREGW